jgi:hypothetical protein
MVLRPTWQVAASVILLVIGIVGICRDIKEKEEKIKELQKELGGKLEKNQPKHREEQSLDELYKEICKIYQKQTDITCEKLDKKYQEIKIKLTQDKISKERLYEQKIKKLDLEEVNNFCNEPDNKEFVTSFFTTNNEIKDLPEKKISELISLLFGKPNIKESLKNCIEKKIKVLKSEYSEHINIFVKSAIEHIDKKIEKLQDRLDRLQKE